MANSTAFVLAVLLSAGPFSCSKQAEITPETLRSSTDTLVEEHDIGTLIWRVNEEGEVQLLVDEKQDSPDESVQGFVTLGKGEDRVAVVLERSDTGLLLAKLPELEDDELNSITYALMSNGKAVEGAIHLGEAGTADLAAARKGTKDKPGPNGGAVHVLGDDVVEVVADRTSNAARVYILDSNNKPVAPDDRDITLALDGKKTEVIHLEPVEGQVYLEGSFHEDVSPQKLTVSVKHNGKRHIAIVGWSTTSNIRLGRKGTHLYFFVNRGWEVEHKVEVDHHVKVDTHDHKKHHKHKKHHDHKKHHGHDDHQDVKIRSKGGGTRVDVKVK